VLCALWNRFGGTEENRMEQSGKANHRKSDEAADEQGGEDLHEHDALSLFVSSPRDAAMIIG
jgi:hypothetical protein